MKTKIRSLFLSACLVAGLTACTPQSAPEPAETAPPPSSSTIEEEAGAMPSSQPEGEAAPEPAVSGMTRQPVQQALSSGVSVNAVAVYPSDMDFSHLTAYAGTLRRFDEEAVKSALLGDASLEREEAQETADSPFPDALHHFYETDAGTWLTVSGSTVGFTSPTAGETTQFFYSVKDGLNYNGDLFLTGEDLPFATRQQAYDVLRGKLDELGIQTAEKYECYTLEHTRLQSEADRLYVQYPWEGEKPAYTAGQDSYFFRFYGSAGGGPITAQGNGIFENGGYISGMTIEALYGADGIRELFISSVYDPGEAVAQGPGLDLDGALAKLDEKYGSILLDGTYEVQDIAFEYVPTANGSALEVTLTPTWHFGVMHIMDFGAKDGSAGTVEIPAYEHVMLNALTGQELPTDLGGA